MFNYFFKVTCCVLPLFTTAFTPQIVSNYHDVTRLFLVWLLEYPLFSLWDEKLFRCRRANLSEHSYKFFNGSIRCCIHLSCQLYRLSNVTNRSEILNRKARKISLSGHDLQRRIKNKGWSAPLYFTAAAADWSMRQEFNKFDIHNLFNCSSPLT